MGSAERRGPAVVPIEAPIPSGAGPDSAAGPASAAGPDGRRPATLSGTPSPAVWCSGISKRYGRREALSSVSLTIGRGEVVGLLGPNGAGKTSLIKILLGLVTADAGEVMLLGTRGDRPASRTGVGYLPELFRYQPWLTAGEVLTFHARLAGLPASRQDRRELLRLVGLEARENDRAGRFSKGMQQRLGLAVALLGEPQLVVLDEPTSALDPIGRADVREIVRELKARGASVLLNSHLIGEVERVCDRVVILDHGQVVASGTLDELLGASEVRLRLDGLQPAARALLERYGTPSYLGDRVRVQGVDPDRIPGLVADLVGLGVQVHAVEPGRQSLEERLLDVLRGSGPGRSRPGPSGAGPTGQGPAGSDRVGGPR